MHLFIENEPLLQKQNKTKNAIEIGRGWVGIKEHQKQNLPRIDSD